MRIWWLRKGLSVLLVYSFSLLSLAADQASTQAQGAVLHAAGRVQINGLAGLATKALLPGDLVETYENSVAYITTAGTSIQVMPNSTARFNSAAIELSHGDVIIATSNGMAATVDDLTIAPASQGQAKFEVAENEESVTIAAWQGSLTVSDGQGSSTVQEGQQIRRKRKRKKEGGGAEVAATGPVLSRQALAFLLGAAGVTIGALLIGGQGSTNCVSPSGAKNCN
ncbi:MAG TPA: hypothetical protein VEK33_15355 [Terriglobales bacterium]|nr:hypothetical protein [Terriglobales bacterium]